MTSTPEFDVRYARTRSGQHVAYGITGSGPAVVIPPSTLAASYFVKSQPGRLWGSLRNEFTVVMYDHLGSGLSDRQPFDYSLDGFQAELLAVLDAAGFDRFALLALPAAGPNAIRLAVDQPDRVSGLVLVATWARGSDYVDNPRFVSYRRGFEDDWELGTEAYARLLGRLSGEEAIATAAVIREAGDRRTKTSTHHE